MIEHINAIEYLIDSIDTYNFKCQGGSLRLCSEWMEIKEHMAELRREYQNVR